MVHLFWSIPVGIGPSEFDGKVLRCFVPKEIMKSLIVNAADFGLTEGVNRAVVAGHVHGIITSTSLLANGAAFDSAVTMTEDHVRLGVGVHLNLTEGRPVSVS